MELWFFLVAILLHLLFAGSKLKKFFLYFPIFITVKFFISFLFEKINDITLFFVVLAEILFFGRLALNFFFIECLILLKFFEIYFFLDVEWHSFNFKFEFMILSP